MKLSRAALILCISLLAACATSGVAVHYLILAPTSSGLPSGRTPALSVGPVTVPDYLSRNSLAQRTGTHSIVYRGDQRWAEPLDRGIKRIVAADLGIALDTARVVEFPSLEALESDFRVALDVHRFETEVDTAVAQIEWLLFAKGKADPLANGSFEGSRRVDASSANATAAALSELLGEFATDLARKLPVARKL